MDIAELKQIAIDLRLALKKENVRASLIILFGSQANQTATENSDIDLAVISPDFGNDRFLEGSMLNRIASKINHKIEAIPVSLHSYFDLKSISPIMNEIVTKGKVLL